MKLTILLLTTTLLQVHATGFSQKVTYSGKNVNLQTVFKDVEKQTGFAFFYHEDVLSDAKPVSIDADHLSLPHFLDELFKEQLLSYSIKGKNVIVRKKIESTPSGALKYPAISPSLNTPPITVRGRIVNEKGEPVIASVLIKGSTKGTTTDVEGNFELKNVEDNAVLIISGTNIETKEINVQGRSSIVINTITKISSEEEVIVNAGYYSVKDKERTGSISRVSSKVIEQQPVVNPLLALSGRMPGVFIQQTSGTPGGNIRIQIRGRNSLRLNGNEPLYIIDGVPFSTEKTFSSFTDLGTIFGPVKTDEETQSNLSPLSSINNADIESIEVLKDADATAVYGSRGANGVVLITTKKGKPGKTKFDLNVYNGISIVKKLKLLNTQQYLQLRHEAFNNSNVIPSSNASDPGYAPDLTIWDTTLYTDWQKEFLGAARTTSTQASLSGGNTQTKYLFGVGYRKENNVYSKEHGYQKGSFHLSLNNQSTNKKFNFNSSITGSKDKNDQVVSGLMESRRLPPNAPELYTADGKLNWAQSTWQNPIANFQIIYNNNVVALTANSVISYELIKGLQLKSSFGINYLNSNETYKKPSTYFDPALGDNGKQASVRQSNGTNQSWIIEPQLSWEKVIGKGKFSTLLGCTFQDQQLQRNTDQAYGFTNDNLLDNLSAASDYNNLENISELYRYSAIFGRINYNWQGKYIINLTGRRDGSSRFGPRKQFSNFAAAGIAWVFSEEEWFKNAVNIINFGKLRTSYGTTGNDQIGNYRYLDTYSPATNLGGNQYDGIAFLSPTRLFNPDYAWEINRKLEAALELGLTNNRLSVTVNYYRNRSSNQLVDYTLPITTGFNGILANLPATVQNTGWEFELTSKNIKSKNLEWSSSFNLSIPRNKLLSFPNLESSTYVNRYVIGMPLSIDKYFHSLGVDPQTGLWIFEDINKDGVITYQEDQKTPVFIGQDFYGGINNSFNYKNISLDVFFQFVKQTGEGGVLSYGMPGEMINIPRFILDKSIWRRPGDIAEIQRLNVGSRTATSLAYSQYRSSDASIIDASFIRLKNVSLSYMLPQRVTKNFSCRFYFQGQNLLLISNYEGDDPENQSFNGLPPLKMFTVGVQLTL